MASNGQVTRRGGARKAKVVEYQSWREGKVGLTRMANIAGINPTRLSQLTLMGRIPVETIDGLRFYPVDRILAMAADSQLPFGPLHCEKRDPLAEACWAWDALATGPARCETAPSGRAWRLYLDAKEDPVVRRRLSGIHMTQASRALDQSPRYGLEDAESSALAAGSGEVDDGEYVEPATPPSIFGDLDKVAGSLAVGFEPVPEPVGGETEY